MSNGKRFDALQWLIEWHAQYWHTISGFRGNSLCRHRGRSLTGGAAQVFDVGWKLLVEAQAERSRYLQTCSKTHPREQYFKDKHFKYYYWVSWNIIQHHKISWSNQQHVYIPQGYWMRHRLSSLKTGLLKFVPESWDMPCWIRACMSSFIFGVAWVPCRSRELDVFFRTNWKSLCGAGWLGAGWQSHGQRRQHLRGQQNQQAFGPQETFDKCLASALGTFVSVSSHAGSFLDAS